MRLQTMRLLCQPIARRAIPDDLAPILKRLRIAPEHWIDTVGRFGRLFRVAAGGLDAQAGGDGPPLAPRRATRRDRLSLKRSMMRRAGLT